MDCDRACQQVGFDLDLDLGFDFGVALGFQTPMTRRHSIQTRRALHMDVRRSPTEPWMASWKIPAPDQPPVRFVGETFFFGSVSLTRIFGAGFAVRTSCVGVYQKKRTRPRQRSKAFDLRSKSRNKASTRLTASVLLFFAGPKKSKQKKRPSRRSEPGEPLPPGFSDSASCLGRKTPPIHGRRPSGLQTVAQASRQSKALRPHPTTT